MNFVELAFNLEKKGKMLNADFTVLFIKRMHVDINRLTHSHLFNWIAWLTQKNTEAAIEVSESLMEKNTACGTVLNQLSHSEPLLAALNDILKEADESENEMLIKRAVRLQDQFLRIDLNGMEAFLEQAATI